MEKLNALEKWCQEVVDSWPATTKLESFNHRLVRDVAEAFRALEQRAEAAEAKLAGREQYDEEAMHCATILEFIGNFGSDDIDGDCVDLRFEIDGEDTGCDVSITEYALRSAKAIRSVLSGAHISRPAPAVSLAELVPDDTKRMDWLVSKAVNVREPLPYGSHNIFWSQQTSDDCDENYATDLREQIDSAMRNIEEAG